MQFGVFTVGDVTPDPTTGRDADRGRADQGDGHDRAARPRRSGSTSSPPASTTTRRSCRRRRPRLLGYIAAQTERLLLSTATTLITTNDPVKIAEDYAMLQHLADGRVDLMLGRGNTGPVYPWFGQDIRDGIAARLENYALLRRLWREDDRRLGGPVPHAAAGLHLHAAAAGRRAAVRLARLDPHPRDRRAGRVLRRRLLRQPHLLAGRAHRADGRPLPAALRALRPRPGRPGDRRPRRPGLHAEEQPGRGARVPAVLRQRPGVRARPVAGGVHGRDAADRGQPAAGDRADARLPRRTSATTSASCS